MSDKQNVVEAREAGEYFRVQEGGHFEHGLIRGAGRDFSDYSHYVSDHHLVEIMVGGVNWREFGGRSTRVGEPIDNRVFLLYEEENFSLNVSHTYGTLSGNTPSGGGAGATGKVISGAAKIAQGLGQAASGAFAAFQGADGKSDLMLSPLRILNAQFYQSSEPWSFSLPFTFRMGQNGLWDARKEVFDPIMALLTMVTVIDKGDTAKIGVNDDVSISDIPVYETPGNTLMGMLGSIGSELVTGGIDTFQEEGGKATFASILRKISSGAEETLEGLSKNVTIVMGLTHEEAGTGEDGQFIGANRDDWNQRNVFFFNPCVIKSATITLNREKDMRGFPITGSVNLTVETMMPAMANDISGIVQAGEKMEVLASDAFEFLFSGPNAQEGVGGDIDERNAASSDASQAMGDVF